MASPGSDYRATMTRTTLSEILQGRVSDKVLHDARKEVRALVQGTRDSNAGVQVALNVGSVVSDTVKRQVRIQIAGQL